MHNFPYSDKRKNQPYVLNEISEAYNSGYKYIIFEAATGFGKSAVAVAVALRWARTISALPPKICKDNIPTIFLI